ncbi:MAG: acylneuraminate cytidylyltransferase family protein [Nanoarchaeota archaeon]|nr:acylneuraminate cytidylyltransferase family protein [Nanoarchaeota archaeon]
MIKKKSVVAIIPARGGSKGIPRKNIKLLNGKPLIAYSIEQAKQSEFVDRVFVSTEDKEIAEISKEYNSEVISRPQELAEDNTPMMPVLKHALDYLENKLKFKADIVVLLQPTSPLRKTKYIDKAIKELINHNCETVTTIYKIEHNINTLVKIKDGKTKYFIKKDPIALRQTSEEIYRIDGMVFVLKKEKISDEIDYIVSDDNNRAIVVPYEDGLEIDSPFEFELAEFLIKNRRNKNETMC